MKLMMTVLTNLLFYSSSPTSPLHPHPHSSHSTNSLTQHHALHPHSRSSCFRLTGSSSPFSEGRL